jgi:hypothetical protein
METKNTPNQKAKQPHSFLHACKCLAYASVFPLIYLLGKFVTTL